MKNEERRTNTAGRCATRLVILLIAGWMTIGCASPSQQLVETPPRHAPVTALEPCAEPSVLSTGDFAEVFSEYLELLLQYRECRAKHSELSSWVQEAYK